MVQYIKDGHFDLVSPAEVSRVVEEHEPTLSLQKNEKATIDVGVKESNLVKSSVEG